MKMETLKVQTAEQQILINTLEQRITESIEQNRREHNDIKEDQKLVHRKIDKMADCINEMPGKLKDNFASKNIERVVYGLLTIILASAITGLITFLNG